MGGTGTMHIRKRRDAALKVQATLEMAQEEKTIAQLSGASAAHAGDEYWPNLSEASTEQGIQRTRRPSLSVKGIDHK
jgi:hypothetical protein